MNGKGNYSDYQNPTSPYVANSNGTFSYVSNPIPLYSDATINKKSIENCPKSKLPSYDDDDALHGLDLCEKLAFYKRLVKRVKEKDNDSLAALLMDHWIRGEGYPMVIPNDRIRNNKLVKEQIKIYRDIFLSKRETNWRSRPNKIGGVVPKLREGKWDGISDFKMTYQGQSFGILTGARFSEIYLKLSWNKKLSREEEIDLDLWTSLHSTSIESEVIVTGDKLPNNEVKVSFKKWTNNIKDNYNWNIGNPLFPNNLIVPNPDFNNRYGVPNPVKSKSRKVKVYHVHALELEENEMAHSFDFKSVPWVNIVSGDTVSF